MKVKDLIKQLEKFNPELDVFISNQEEEIIDLNNLVRFFDIADISAANAETKRNDISGVVEFTFVGMSTKHSREFVFIDVVSQF